MTEKVKKIYAVGLGPGNIDLLTPMAEKVIRRCDTVAGYINYIKLFPELFDGKKIITTGMTGEKERCIKALEAVLEEEETVVVSSGDAGVYGMAGLLMELIRDEKRFTGIRVEVIPGITAASAAAAILGAPLMNDFAVLSLSDLMTPQDIILKRVRAVAEAGLVCAVYNPASRKRRKLLEDTVAIFRESRADSTPVGIVHYAERPGQEVVITELSEIAYDSIAMNTILIIGNEQTIVHDGRMLTLRGYTGLNNG